MKISIITTSIKIMQQFQARSQKCEKQLLASSCLSVRMGQLDSHWTDFHEILYLIIFRKSEMTTLTEVFPCFLLSCKANARVTLAKTGHGPHPSKLVVICVVLSLFVLFCRYFCCSVVIVLYCCYMCCSVIICIVLCIVCV